jgi:hypothetical protein
MTTAGTGVLRPSPVELIAADEVRRVIADVDLRLATLERKAAESRATADELERRAEAEGVGAEASTWAIVRLQRFLDGLRAEAEQDAATIVAAARKGADARIEEARADAAHVRHAASANYDPGPVAPRVTAIERFDAPPVLPTPVAVPVPNPVVATEVIAVVDAQANGHPEGDADDDVRWAPMGVPVQAATNGAATSAPPPPPSAPAASVYAPPAPAPAPAPVPAFAPEPVPEPPAAPPVELTAPAPTLAPPRRKRFLRGFPISAVLEVLAVLLVLLFILLRLS